MTYKPKSPYQRLLEDTRDWARKVMYRHSVGMWTYPKAKLTEGYRLDDLYERVQAAEQLGYEVVVVANETGLFVRYVKKIPKPPHLLGM